MTKEEALQILDTIPTISEQVDALEMAIQALSQEPCDDAISREAVLDTTICEGISCDECSFNEIDGESGCLLHARIDELPSVTPKPETVTEFADRCRECGSRYGKLLKQKYGKWIEHPEIETSAPEYLMFYECSECGDKQCFCKSDIHKKRFCNNCGAKMFEPQEGVNE